SMFASEPVSRLSRQRTRWPSPRRASHRCEPRNPAPPVTTDVGMAAMLQAPLAGSVTSKRSLYFTAPERPEDSAGTCSFEHEDEGQRDVEEPRVQVRDIVEAVDDDGDDNRG